MKPAPRKPGNARQRFRRLLHGTLVALLPFAALSCGDGEDRKPVYPVQGQLVVDGKPARGGYVLFHPVNDADPKATRPHGQVSQDGTFLLSTYKANDGAPIGDYVVTIDWRKAVPGHGPRGPNLLPPEYVWLQCTETGELNYRVQVNTRGGISEELKVGLRKYCPRLRKHTIHKIKRK